MKSQIRIFFSKGREMRSAEQKGLCKYRRPLSDEYFIAEFGVDTAKNAKREGGSCGLGSGPVERHRRSRVRSEGAREQGFGWRGVRPRKTKNHQHFGLRPIVLGCIETLQHFTKKVPISSRISQRSVDCGDITDIYIVTISAYIYTN